MDILKKKFRVSFTEVADSANMKRKKDTIIINDQPIRKKVKEYDYDLNHQNDDYLVNVCFCYVLLFGEISVAQKNKNWSLFEKKERTKERENNNPNA